MIDARIIDLSEAPALPRLQATHGRALNNMYMSAPSVAVASTALAGQLHFTFFNEPLTGIEPWCWHRFKLGAHTGALAIDSIGLALLLQEPQVARLPSDLRTLLLADSLHGAIERLEQILRVRFEWLPDDGQPPHVSASSREAMLGFTLQTNDARVALRGVISFADAAALAALVPGFNRRQSFDSAGFDSVRMPLRFELGSTQLTVRELKQIRSGAVISVEHWAANGEALHVIGQVGGRRGVHLAGLALDTQITLAVIGEPVMSYDEQDLAAAPTGNEPANLPLDRLDALEVVVRFEVGELSLSLGELKNLRPGHVFELRETLNRSTVRILTHGNVLGKGYLVAIGEHLGVRVSEFAPSGL